MNIRPATLSDRDAILALAEEQCVRYPLRPDREKMLTGVTTAISSPQHFAYVVEAEKKIRGTLLAFTSDNLWAQRQNCNIVLWFSKEPMAGAAMLRAFRDWVQPRRAIRVAGMSPDLDVDPRALRLAERIGFEKNGGAYLLYN